MANIQQNQSQYNSFTTQKGNIIWAGALSLAWIELKQRFVKENIQLQTHNIDCIRAVNNFNQSKFAKTEISQTNIYIKSGYGQLTLETINSQVKQKFPQKTFQDLNYKLSPSDIISYAYLFKRLAFEYKFQVRQKQQFQFNKKKVKSLYAENEEQKRQIKYCDYKNKNNFILRLNDKSNKDYLYLLKTEKEAKIDQIISYIMKSEENNKFQHLSKEDYFQMPFVELSCTRQFKQLEGLYFVNDSMKGYLLAVVIESLKLTIDESGVKMENEAVITTEKSSVLKKIQPKFFHLDHSFWIIMKQPKKHPYICVYLMSPKDL